MGGHHHCDIDESVQATACIDDLERLETRMCVRACVVVTYDDQQGCGNGCGGPSKSGTDEVMMRRGKARTNRRIEQFVGASCHDGRSVS